MAVGGIDSVITFAAQFDTKAEEVRIIGVLCATQSTQGRFTLSESSGGTTYFDSGVVATDTSSYFQVGGVFSGAHMASIPAGATCYLYIQRR